MMSVKALRNRLLSSVSWPGLPWRFMSTGRVYSSGAADIIEWGNV